MATVPREVDVPGLPPLLDCSVSYPVNRAMAVTAMQVLELERLACGHPHFNACNKFSIHMILLS
jgi:hypothetical protein